MLNLFFIDKAMKNLLIGIFSLLLISSIVGHLLRQKLTNKNAKEAIDNLIARIKAWWMMTFVFVVTMLIGRLGSIILFGLISFLALKEFIRLIPITKRGEKRALIWSYLIILPFQYYLVAIKWYGMFSIFIPVYAFLFISTRLALADDYEHFFELTARIQWGLMVCVYFISHAPALLMLKITGFERQNVKLLFFLVVIVQLSDVFQYIFGKCFGKTRLVPQISPNKTLEGFLGGIITATLVGTSLWWITPFTPLQAMVISLIITIMGFLGGLTMSAIKRDRGMKDYGTLIAGHGGILDRIDSLCFAAPVFFHLIRYYFT